MNDFTFVKNNWAKLGLANYKTGVSSTKMKEAFKKAKDVNTKALKTSVEADNSRKRREAEMAKRTQQINDYTNKLKKEATTRKKRAFLPFDIDEYDLPKLKKAIILFMTDTKDAPAGAVAKLRGKNKLLKASNTSIYELMQRMNIQESDIADYYKDLVKRPHKKEDHEKINQD